MRTPAAASRWTVPAAVAAAVVGGTLVVPAVASAAPELPPTTAEQLLAKVAAADAQDLSGTVEQTADLGLPELPEGQGATGGLSTLLAGTTTARVWSDGPERSRVAVLGRLAETTVVRDSSDVWMWRSDTGSAVHATVPEHPDGDAPAGAGGPAAGTSGRLPADAMTPAQAARAALEAVDPSTAVTLDGTARVAGRDAYELVLTPRDTASLVGSVRLAVDATTSSPLRVQVFARGASKPAFSSGFTKVSFETPEASVFRFTPPQGARVTELEPPAGHPGAKGAPGQHAPMAPGGAPASVVGQGWTSVLVLHGTDPAAMADPSAAPSAAPSGGAGDGADGGADGGDPTGGIAPAIMAAFRPVSGDFGSGRLLTTSLVSVLALDDGRVLVGSVGPEALERAAGDPAAAAPAAPAQ